MQLINNATAEKLRGGFYTPAPIVSFLLKWALNGDKSLDILEPSCGDGAFLRGLKDGDYEYNSITAMELDSEEARKARKISLKNCRVTTAEFHKFCINTNQRYDIIIGNPPYVRYQYFDREQQQFASQIFNKAGLSYSKLTNAWVSFVIGSSLLLKEKGKIAFVLPAEILQVSYAKQLREFLSHYFNKINIISFGELKLIASSILTKRILSRT